ncbi:hypothetical protein Sjap_016096 [Stephania japonica]|uniref:Uncharacterized protein n=1 Tax=Stephania japonica TaxID=461633 RepID=A0AAP0IKF0_9MAGN
MADLPDHDHHDIPFLRETTDPYEFLHIVYNPTDDTLTRHSSTLEKDNPTLPFSAAPPQHMAQALQTHHHFTTQTPPHTLLPRRSLHPLQRRQLHVSQNSYMALAPWRSGQ